MAKSDDKKPGTQRQLFDRMDGEAQQARSDMFRRITSGKNKPTAYGTGDPAKIGTGATKAAPKKAKK